MLDLCVGTDKAGKLVEVVMREKWGNQRKGHSSFGQKPVLCAFALCKVSGEARELFTENWKTRSMVGFGSRKS